MEIVPNIEEEAEDIFQLAEFEDDGDDGDGNGSAPSGNQAEDGERGGYSDNMFCGEFRPVNLRNITINVLIGRNAAINS